MRHPSPFRRLAVLELERRENPALAVVSGTPDYDIITLQNLASRTVQVTVASYSDPAYTTPVGPPTTTTVDGTDGISVLAGDGDDTVKIVGDRPLTANTQIDGGAGNDRVAVFAPVGQPVTFAGGAGTDTVDLFASVQNSGGNPQGDTLYATDAAVARMFENAVFFTGTESTVVHGTMYSDTLIASAGLPAPMTFVQGGGQVIDSVYLGGTAGDDVFYASDTAVDRSGDPAVFLPADPTSTANVIVSGNDGNDIFSAAAELAVQPRADAFAGDYTFDGGPGVDAVYLNGTTGNDHFGLTGATGLGTGVGVRSDPAAASVIAFNAEVVTLYGYAGDDTLTVDPTYFTNIAVPMAVGFAGGAGTDTVQVHDLRPQYQFGPGQVDGPNGRTMFYDSVEATGVVD